MSSAGSRLEAPPRAVTRQALRPAVQAPRVSMTIPAEIKSLRVRFMDVSRGLLIALNPTP